MRMRWWLGVGMLVFSVGAWAAQGDLPLFSVAGARIGVAPAAWPFLALFPFLPALALAFSAFTRIAVVLFLLRQGLGSEHAPPNVVLLGLSLLLTWFVMTPTLNRIDSVAWQPYQQGTLAAQAAANAAAVPLKEFMLRQTRREDLQMFLGRPVSDADLKAPAQLAMDALAPAFFVSELQTAFRVGFMVILPFLIIDLVVSSVLMALGMVMVPPQLVSFPMKLMLFVLADGWHLLAGSLIQSF